MKELLVLLFLSILITACQSQSQRQSKITVGGRCQDCEAIYDYADKQLSTTDTLPSFHKVNPKLEITGTIYLLDGKTPAKDVILYTYHTDRDGLYSNRGQADDWGRIHGENRGWIKTDHTGQFRFYTFRPAPYPSGQECEHIHLTVKEPNKNEYYIDSIVFDDDPLLTLDVKNALHNRGGSGITTPILKDGMLRVQRDIILGKNIPDYQ